MLLTIKSLKREIKPPNKVKQLADKCRYYKTKCSQLTSQLRTFECEECKKLDVTVAELKKEKRDLLEYNAELKEEIKLKSTNKVHFFNEGKYIDSLRFCVMELLSYNVSELKIEPVIRSVLKLLKIWTVINSYNQ